MTRNGVSESVIINHIYTTGLQRRIDTNENHLAASTGVPENVINAMQQAPLRSTFTGSTTICWRSTNDDHDTTWRHCYRSRTVRHTNLHCANLRPAFVPNLLSRRSETPRGSRDCLARKAYALQSRWALAPVSKRSAWRRFAWRMYRLPTGSLRKPGLAPIG